MDCTFWGKESKHQKAKYFGCHCRNLFYIFIFPFLVGLSVVAINRRHREMNIKKKNLQTHRKKCEHACLHRRFFLGYLTGIATIKLMRHSFTSVITTLLMICSAADVIRTHTVSLSHFGKLLYYLSHVVGRFRHRRRRCSCCCCCCCHHCCFDFEGDNNNCTPGASDHSIELTTQLQKTVLNRSLT